MFTSDFQFGFKAGHSTSMCSLVLKEALAYYVVDDGSTLYTFLDAAKAFDRVYYCERFRELLKHNLPCIYIRLLVNLYTSNIADMTCKTFYVNNVVIQGGIVSSALLCIYIDGLLHNAA